MNRRYRYVVLERDTGSIRPITDEESKKIIDCDEIIKKIFVEAIAEKIDKDIMGKSEKVWK